MEQRSLRSLRGSKFGRAEYTGIATISELKALPNLVNPFWMLPLLGILKLKARDIVGYGVLQLMIHIPVVFFLCWLFARYIPYLPPMK